MRVPLLRACSRTSGSTASISASRADRLARLLAAAHEVVHALDDAAGALGLLGDALDRLAQHRRCVVGVAAPRRSRFSEPVA